MKYTSSTLYRKELPDIADVLELINYRPRTIDSYLQSIFECCTWLKATYDISMIDADVQQLRAFLLHLKRSKEDGGLGYAPRSVNIYNCALKKYFRCNCSGTLNSTWKYLGQNAEIYYFALPVYALLC